MPKIPNGAAHSMLPAFLSAANDAEAVADLKSATREEFDSALVQLAPTNNSESAILVTLVPGNYTAIVRGKNNATGVALVEVFKIGS